MIDPAHVPPAQTSTSPDYVVATIEPAFVWDGGRRSLAMTNAGAALSNSSMVVVAAAASVKTKVLGFNVVISVHTTPGPIIFRDGAAGSTLWTVAQTTGITNYTVGFGGPMLFQTSVNTTLELMWFTGAGTATVNVLYYQAP